MDGGGVAVQGVDAEFIGSFGQTANGVVKSFGLAKARQSQGNTLRAAVEGSVVIEVDVQPSFGHAVVVGDAAGDFSAEHQQVVVLVDGSFADDTGRQAG